MQGRSVRVRGPTSATQLCSYCPSVCAHACPCKMGPKPGTPPTVQRPRPFPSDSASLETESPLPPIPRASAKKQAHTGVSWLAASLGGLEGPRAQLCQNRGDTVQGHSVLRGLRLPACLYLHKSCRSLSSVLLLRLKKYTCLQPLVSLPFLDSFPNLGGGPGLCLPLLRTLFRAAAAVSSVLGIRPALHRLVLAVAVTAVCKQPGRERCVH